MAVNSGNSSRVLSSRKNRIEPLICMAVLVALPVLWWYPLLTAGTLPWSFDHLYFLAPWEEARPMGMAAPAHPDHAEVATRLYPQYHFLAETVANRYSTLWNPYENCGEPFFAQWETRVLSPFSIPIYLFPLDRALALSVILKMIAAGLCAYYASRRLAHGVPASLAVGLAYQLGAAFTLWHAWPLSDALPWFPLLLVYVDHLHMDGKRSWPLAALGFTLVLLGGGPGISVGVALFLLAYLLARHLLDGAPARAFVRRGTALTGVLLAGAGLALVQVVPYLETLRQGAYAPGAVAPLAWTHFAALLFPHLFGGDPQSVAEAGNAATPRLLGLIHVGIAPVLSLTLWWAVRPFLHPAQRKRMEAMVWVALAFTGAALFAGAIPALRTVEPAWLLFANGLVAILLAASAAEEWGMLDPEEVTVALRRFLVAQVPLAVLIGVLAVPGFFVSRPASVSVPAQLGISGGLAICLGLFLLWTLFKPSGRVLGYGLALVMVLDLGLAVRPFLTFSSPEERYPETPFIAALREQEARVTGSSALAGWPLSVHGLPQVLGAGRYRTDRHAAFMERVADDPMLLRRTGAGNLLLTREDIQGPFARVRPDLRILSVFESGAVLCSDLGTPSRARLVHEARPVRAFDPADLSSELAPLLEGPEPVRPVPGSWARVEPVREEGTHRAFVAVEEARPGYLILSDSYYPGWQATIDGQRTALFPADGLFRAVAAPEGDFEAAFEYRPASVPAGVALSLLTACLVAALALRQARANRKPAGTVRSPWLDVEIAAGGSS